MACGAACGVAIATAAAVALGWSGPAGAQPLGAAPIPSETAPDWAASTLPTPISDDAFFDRPAGDMAALQPGAIIRSRQVRVADFSHPANDATQIMVRSTDSHGRPIAATATLIVPVTPWEGSGSRPLLVVDQAINSLGAECTPGYAMVHKPGGLELPPLTAISLWHGQAVLIPDHEGPNMAYAAGVLGGHITLDGIRGVRQLRAANLAESHVVLIGYSGGAIAAGWAAQLAPEYAPELPLAGVALGGTPADLAGLQPTMDGTLGSGLYAAASFGLTREYPELLTAANEAGKIALQSELRNVCDTEAMALGVTMAPISIFTFPHVQDSPVIQRVFDQTRMGGAAPTAPILIYHGAAAKGLGDEFIPVSEGENLWRQWCALGANVRFEAVTGEHMIASLTASPLLLGWISARFAGETAVGNCPP